MTRSGDRKHRRRCRGSVAALPMDVLDEILCRLPMKSLLRCKSVCKLWYSVIKSPLFISNHYSLQSNRPFTVFVEKIGHKFVRFSNKNPIAFNPATQTSPLINQGGASALFSYYVGLPWLGIFLRPLNGLFLMLVPNVERCRMALLNPATRQFHGLIDFEYQPQQRNVFGFGICKTDVYKVVWLKIEPTRRHVAVAKVYTVGENGDWRIINEALPRDFVIKYSPNPFLNISMNGKCYWLSEDFASMLLFDMDKEAFHELDTPVPSVNHPVHESLYDRKSKDVMLSEVKCCDEGDSLALFVFKRYFVDMFVMDKEEEWHQIRRLVTCINRPVCDLLDPVGQLEFRITDAILLNGRNSFALYSPNTNLCVHFRKSSPLEYSLIFVFKFKESLVSVDGEIQVSDHVLEDFSTF